MQIEIIQAKSGADAAFVSSILQEAADWLIAKGVKLWETDELSVDKIFEQVENGMFWLVKIDGGFAGCIRYQNEDSEYWDDVPHTDSAFVHKVAVRRRFAGQNVSENLIEWAKHKAKAEGNKFLRLDCAKREKLCRLYESFGFVVHSEKIRKPYPVIRYEFDLQNLD